MISGSRGAPGSSREAAAVQLPAAEFNRKIKNEIREVTAENIMKYINLDKVVQWVIKSEIGRRGEQLQPHTSPRR